MNRDARTHRRQMIREARKLSWETERFASLAEDGGPYTREALDLLKIASSIVMRASILDGVEDD